MRHRLWLPENETPRVNITLDVGLSGYFHVQLVDAKTGVIKQELQFKNLLTDSCLNGIGSGLFSTGIGPTGFTHLAVGTGASTPSFSNTTLDAEIARTNSNGGIVDVLGSNASPEYGYVRRTRVFTTAQANGNLRELGFFNATSGGTLLNRALFRDSAGNPTTVTKTNQDILVVIYEWRLSAPTGDQSGSFDYFNGTQTTDWFLRPQGVNQDTHWVNHTLYIGDWSATALNSLALFSNSTFFNTRTGINTPAVDTGGITAVTPSTYVTTSFQRDVNYRLGILDGNTGDISLLVFSPWDSNTGGNRRYMYQMSFTPGLLKNSLRQIDLSIRYTWQRV